MCFDGEGNTQRRGLFGDDLNVVMLTTVIYINPCAAELFVCIFRHLKLELLTQSPASNDEKYLYL